MLKQPFENNIIQTVDAGNWPNTVRNLQSTGMIDRIAAALLKSPALIGEITLYLRMPEQTVAWRTAWIIDKIAEKNTTLITPFHAVFVDALKVTPHNGVRRHLLKILGNSPTQACEDGELIDKCFEWIVHPKIPVAVKANAMELIYRLCCIYPELATELTLVIEDGFLTGTAGYRCKGKNILKLLQKQL
ncbi:MAG: hypothetical protein LBV41_08895 [Cytophagaceae bacterium]|jgi:hypothetical protein|nr:hypothetical protein [Cytophagaceae bacterium]